ncbi:MAG TPA: hypothetical protein VFQ35_23485, partial [Polyangiaceae bacterium]|nr:hypothetical protein [Polyangiaceae bacterium]
MLREHGRLLCRCAYGIVVALLGVAACSSDEQSANAPSVEQQDLSCPTQAIGPSPLKRLTRFEY